jgi:hypothetical protein
MKLREFRIASGALDVYEIAELAGHHQCSSINAGPASSGDVERVDWDS